MSYRGLHIESEAAMLRQLKVRRHLTPMLCLVSLALLTLTRAWHGSTAAASPPPLLASINMHREPAPRLQWARVQRDGHRFVPPLPHGGRAELTLDPALQSPAHRP